MERIKPSKSIKQLNVLYVEDEGIIRESFALLIERYAKKLFLAENGHEGLKIFENEQIDLIISDIKMPKMTGIEMAKEIRKKNIEIPIIFTTAFGEIEYLKDSLDLGIDGYILKPVDRNKFFARLNIIAERLVANNEFNNYVKLIKILFDSQKNGLVLFDKEFNVKLYNESFKNLCKAAKEESLTNVQDFHCLLGGKENTEEVFKEMLTKGFTHECRFADKKLFFDIDLKQVDDYYIMSFTDVTQYKKETNDIKESAMIDNLTGLYNRKKLEVIESDILNKKLCLMIFDIDDFKKINDTYGHLKGDEVLQILAKTVKGNLRESDLIIRWGGEEFLVLLLNLNDNDIARNLAEKLRFKINELYVDKVGRFTCSFGVSCGLIKAKDDFNNILEKADKALYKAKQTGKNKVVTDFDV